MITKWKSWRKEFETFMIATENEGKDDMIKVSMFLNLIGQQGNELYESFSWIEQGDDKKLNKVMEKFEAHMQANVNITVNRFEFFNYNQHDGQSIDDFIKELTILRKDCVFASDSNINDSLLRDRIICGLRDKALQEKLLRLEPDKSNLSTIMTNCRLHEISKDHSAKIENEEPSVNQIFTTKPNTHGQRYDYGNEYGNGNMAYIKNRRQKPSSSSSSGSSSGLSRSGSWINNCRYCATSHGKAQCKAWNQTCNYCNRRNHLAIACEKKKRDCVSNNSRQSVQAITQDNTSINEDSEVFYMSQIGLEKLQRKDNWNVELLVNKHLKEHFKIDSGAEVSVISWDTFKRLQNPPEVLKTNTKLKAYNQTDIPVMGKCLLQVQHEQKDPHDVEFMIAQYDSVIGGRQSEELQLIQRLFAVNKLPEGIQEDIFDEIGCIDGELTLYLRDDIRPVVQPPRKIPHAMMGKLKMELERMESLGVIYPIQEPTDWVSSLVVQTKDNGKLRICLDPKYLNSAIKRQHYPIPTNEDIVDKLVGAKVFSKLDCSSGYWQIKVSDESSRLLCFNTPYGRYCFTRLPFGVHIASEVFQQKLEAVLEGLEGVANSQDDMIVWGKDKSEHDCRLKKVLETVYNSGFRLNKDKCKFGVNDLIFLGHRITDKGIFADPEKIKAIKDMETPKDKKGVQRFLGMVNFVSKFIPDVSHITAPLRKLINKDEPFQITTEHLEAIDKLKAKLVSNPILQIYDKQKETKIGSDASLYGLGAVLLQKHGTDWLPVAFASRSLTETEKRYAQIEKECLSAVFACNKFHNYVYGRPFTIENDHKPLQTIIKKDLSQMPPRITRMMMVLQKYPDLTFIYVPGAQLKIADALSRAPKSSVTTEIKDMECQIHAVYESLPATDEIREKFKDATKNDDMLQEIAKCVADGWPDHKDCPKHLQQYWSLRDEITAHEGLLYKAHQMLVPAKMRSYVKDKVHTGHLGIVKCKERAKTYFYWPGMASQIEQMVYKCDICQEFRNKQPSETNISVIASKPWSTIGADVFHITLINSHYLILTDYYSSYPEVILLNKGSAHGTSKTTIEKMKQVFSQHGIPETVISDGGPQFISKEFNEFAKSWNFKHQPSSPEYPKGNGRVERSVQTVKKLIKKAVQSKTSIDAAILSYRTTPLQDCNLSPAELLMGRLPRNHLNSHLPVENMKESKRKQYPEKYANQHARDLPKLESGDNVRIRSKGKWSTKAIVVNKHDTPRSYIVKSQYGQTYRRNRKDILKTHETFSFDYTHTLDDDIRYVTEPENGNVTRHGTYFDDLPDLEENYDSDQIIYSELSQESTTSMDNVDNESTNSKASEDDLGDYRRFTNRNVKSPQRWGYSDFGRPLDNNDNNHNHPD